MVEGDELITTADALDILGYASPSAVSRLVEAKRLTPAFKAPGKRGAFAFYRSEVQRLADEITAEVTP